MVVKILPPPLTKYLYQFRLDFEFNSCLVEMVEVVEVFSDNYRVCIWRATLLGMILSSLSLRLTTLLSP